MVAFISLVEPIPWVNYNARPQESKTREEGAGGRRDVSRLVGPAIAQMQKLGSRMS